jgi:ADP-ribosylglycohydrolase
MPTQSLPRPAIVARYGPLLSSFEPGPRDHPLAAGLPAGTVTDDTQQALLLAGLVADGAGEVDQAELGTRLLAWEDTMRARGSLDLLGPSTRRALAAVAAGASPGEAGRYGTTNGAAMRITPVGIATPATDMNLLVGRVVTASKLTHNTSVALAGAAAVAAAVSARLSGAAMPAAAEAAAGAAAAAAVRGHWAAGADVAARIRWATRLAVGLDEEELMDTVYRLVGTSLATQESVPAAFAVAAFSPDDPWRACRMAASLGGDCDTIAAITGAICGAGTGAGAFPAAARATVTAVNRLDLEPLAGRLLTVRAAPALTSAPAPPSAPAGPGGPGDGGGPR